MRSGRRSSILAALTIITVTAGVTSAALASTTKGDPQPELAPFHVAASSEATSSSTMESNGTTLVAYYNASETATEVCILPRNARSCAHVTSVASPHGSDESANPQIFAGAGKTVFLMLANALDGEQYYSSTDGGHTFAGPTTVGGGDFEAVSAALVGTTIAYTDGADSDGVQVATVSTTDPSSNNPIVVDGTEDEVSGLGSYHGGLLAVDQTFADTTVVRYAAPHTDPGSPSSYTTVGSFSHEELVGISGGALLTVSTTGKEQFRLRLFNGTSFGAVHTVPDLAGDLGHWGTVIQDPHGVTHLFYDSNESKFPTYVLYELTTSNGATWSSPARLGYAVKWTAFSGALDKAGTGVLVGGLKPLETWPVLQAASVSFSLHKSSVKRGHAVKASGKGGPAAAGRKVTLERLKGSAWHSVSTTTEKASGAFSFRIKTTKAGKATYRAVTADKGGYVQFGYSAGRKLTVKAK